jgi:hypothetical protein
MFSWTDGCPVLTETSGADPIVVRSYLDPRTGAILPTDVSPPGADRTISTRPDHWSKAKLRDSTDAVV